LEIPAEAFFPLRATTTAADSTRDARAAQTEGSTYDGRVTHQVLEADAGSVGPAAAVTPSSPPPRVLPERPINPPTTIERLRVAMPSDRLNGWIVTLIIGAIAFVIRVVNLGYPNKLVFDETYYAKDAYSLLKFGYERNWPSDANSKIITGDVDLMQDTAAFIVHPQLGKWLIAAGEQVEQRRAEKRPDDHIRQQRMERMAEPRAG
jgi:hypothetical protein